MSKRFTETEKWSDPWFRKLTGTVKLGYLYLLDRVDNAGVIDLDKELANFQIGTEINWNVLLRELGDRVEVLPSGKWHLTRFVRFQFGELKEDCKPHAQVIRLQDSHGIERVSKGYPRGIDTPQDKDKDKDKDKEQDTDKDKGETAEESKTKRKRADDPLPDLPASIDTPAMREAWGRWLAARNSAKKPVRAPGAAQCFADFQRWGIASAIDSINESIRNGYQGLFEPKGKQCQNPAGMHVELIKHRIPDNLREDYNL